MNNVSKLIILAIFLSTGCMRAFENFISTQIRQAGQAVAQGFKTVAPVITVATTAIDFLIAREKEKRRCVQEAEIRKSLFQFQKAFHNCQTKLCEAQVKMVAAAYATGKPYAQNKLEDYKLDVWSNDPAMPTKLFFIEARNCYQRVQDQNRARMFATIMERQSLFN